MFQQKIAVVMANGDEHLAVTDQRDIAALEAQFPAGIGIHTQIRYQAWSSLVRAKTINVTWEKFNKVDCIEASDPEPDLVDELDPTQPAAPGGSS